MTEPTNYASHGNEGVNRTFRRCQELEQEVERLQLALNQSETECGHLQADLGEARREIEQLQADLSAARALVSRPRAELQAENDRLRSAWHTADFVATALSGLLTGAEEPRAECRRLLREAVEALDNQTSLLGATIRDEWWDEARKAGGDHDPTD